MSERFWRALLRSELTSGDAATKKTLAELLLSAVLKDSAGDELSDYIKRLDVPLSQRPLGELCLIPACYNIYSTVLAGYVSQTGGTITIDSQSIAGGCWYSSTGGSYIEFEFYGTWFDVVFRQKGGAVKIYVDGALKATVDLSTLKGPSNSPVWHGPRDLADGYHTVRIEVTSGTVYVVGIMVDPAKNAWRIIPFPYALYSYFNNAQTSLYNLQYYGTQYYGLYARGYSTSYPVFAEKSPVYRTYVYTTTALAAGGVWTSSSVDCLGSRPYAKKIYITLYSDQSGTLCIDYGPDGTNWDGSESISYTGGSTPAIAAVEVKGRYARVRYVNGATAQSVFRLYAYFMGE
jgi:hypothetical protein